MKRYVFAELTEGFEALNAEREGKITLRKVQVMRKPAPQISAKDVLALREKLHPTPLPCVRGFPSKFGAIILAVPLTAMCQQ